MQLSELGVSEKKEKQFNKKGIYTVEDLLNTCPRKYIDCRHPKTPLDAKAGKRCTMLLLIMDVKKRDRYIEVVCREIQTRKSVSVKWFNQPFMYRRVKNLYKMEVIVSGIYTENEWGPQFVNPNVFSTDIKGNLTLFPVYSQISGMSGDYFRETMSKALETISNLQNKYDDETMQRFHLLEEKEVYKKIHSPANIEDIDQARYMIIFDRLYKFAFKMHQDAQGLQKISSYIPNKLKNTNELISRLPYELTDDQKNVVRSFIDEARKGHRVNALIQGDVGAGKTVCAFLLMLTMSDNGYQSALMAPTGVLAKQHYEELKSYVEPMGLSCVYLSGELKAAERKKVLAKIESGEANFIVGTHAVISDRVIFKNLALTIIDEEHKFGVIQKEALKGKAGEGVHSITMSATPIPRSLAMMLYGNSVSIYTISTPSGRVPIQTCVANNDNAIFKFMEKEIKNGHQCYIVCPLITADTIETQDNEGEIPPESVESVYNKANSFFYNNPEIKVGVITGKMKEEEKGEIISSFKKNEYQILIATTIIEVGVNVPNATVITIMDADRMGLAGLHQLRGRVGRSTLQAYCILKSGDNNNERLRIMCETTNGFEIAEQDLKLRGAGDFIGTKQSGDDKNVELMLKYPEFYEDIKDYISEKSIDSIQF